MRVAVLFRTHFWDDMVEYALYRCEEVSRGCDIYVSVNISAGDVPVPSRFQKHSFTRKAAHDAGLFVCDRYGDPIWYNGDYPIYLFMRDQPTYDYYIQLEYDARCNMQLLDFAEYMRSRSLDFIFSESQGSRDDWSWSFTLAEYYSPRDEVRRGLFAVSGFSRSALEYLFHRRIAHYRSFEANSFGEWPICEAFVPTELSMAGYRLGDLRDLGDASRLVWWPPSLESDLPAVGGAVVFAHPVLGPEKYIRSLLAHDWAVMTYFDPSSIVRSRLEELDVAKYGPVLAGRLRELGRDAEALQIESLITESRGPRSGVSKGVSLAPDLRS